MNWRNWPHIDGFNCDFVVSQWKPPHIFFIARLFSIFSNWPLRRQLRVASSLPLKVKRFTSLIQEAEQCDIFGKNVYAIKRCDDATCFVWHLLTIICEFSNFKWMSLRYQCSWFKWRPEAMVIFMGWPVHLIKMSQIRLL